MKFTIEEINLISIYHTGTRGEVITEMTVALSYMDGDIQELAGRTLEKLNAMSDDDYLQLAIDPADEQDG